VCSARNAELVRSLGADEVLDYAAPDPYRGQAPFDVVLDCVGGSPGRWTRLLGPGGRYGSTFPGPGVFLRQALNPVSSRAVRPVMLRPSGADLADLGRRLADGSLRVVVDSRFPLADLAKAWERSRSGRAVGKIVVTMP
jgi:NADPH:quinone reductase-like Zn-dependent oxidoreductase